MHGKVSVYQGYSDKPIVEESNIIVDGFKEHIVDILTRVPAPSSTFPAVSGTYNASNFTVHAMSFGPSKSTFPRLHSLAALSGYGIVGTTATFKSLDPSDGTSWKYNSDIQNHFFNDVNTLDLTGGQQPCPNSITVNPTFSSFDGVLRNGRFRDYHLDHNLSSVYMNEILGLYELPFWTVQSYLKCGPSSTEYINNYPAGSISRRDMSSVPEIFSSLSGGGYALGDDGILYFRSFATSAERDSSGAAILSQPFVVYRDDMEPLVSFASANVVAEITAQFSAVSATSPGASLQIRLEDETVGDFYNFDTTPTHSRHSWGGDGSSLVLSLTAPISGTLSNFVNIPSDRVRNRFRMEYAFFADSSSTPTFSYFWNANVNLVEGWYFGNIWSGTDMHRVVNNDYQNPALYFECSSVTSNPWEVPLSSTTYISQHVRLDPLKKYSFDARGYDSTVGLNAMRTGIVKWSSGDIKKCGKYNLLTDINSSGIMESCLRNSNYAVSPFLPRTSSVSADTLYRSIKPSDLCLEISAGSMLSGSFSISTSRSARLSGHVLKNFSNTMSGVDVRIKLRTEKADANAGSMYFNFITGLWDTSSSDSIFNTSSIRSTNIFEQFESIQIVPSLLVSDGVISESQVSLILEIENIGKNSAFIKNLRVDSFTPDVKVPEVFNFVFDGNFSMWKKSSYLDRNYIFSGLDGNHLRPFYPNVAAVNYEGKVELIQSMFDSSATNHTSEGSYEVFVVNSELNDSGKHVKVTQGALTDASLVAASSKVSTDEFTSEGYFPLPRLTEVNQPMLSFHQVSSLYSEVSSVNAGGTPWWGVPALWSGTGGMAVGSNVSLNGQPYINGTAVNHTFDFSSIELPTSSTQLAFSFDYTQLVDDAEGSPVVYWGAVASVPCTIPCSNEEECSELVSWNANTSSWDTVMGYEVSANLPLNTFTDTVMRGGATVPKTAFSSKVDITNLNFSEDTKINFFVYTTEYDSGAALHVMSNWKFYTITTPPPKDLPEFPNPYDRHIQTPETPTAELGHYTNQIQYASSLSAINSDRALGNINWAPFSGVSSLVISGVAFDSLANEFSVVNSDGFLLRGYSGLNGTLANKGFVFSSTASSISYVVDIMQSDLSSFDFQGGLSVMGLWALDTKATYKKFKDNGHPLSGNLYDLDTPAWSTDGLYTLSDPTRNPVYKLVAKKVFRLPITLTQASGGGAPTAMIRIVWEISFL